MKNIAINIMTKLMVVIMGLFVSSSVLAQNGNVREETARQVGLNFLRLKDGNPRSDLQLTRVDAVQYPNLYVYNTSENGFIVVASDNRMEPILAYSDEGTFDKDDVAPGANFWFEMYEYTIDSIVRNNVRDVDEKITRKWENLINGDLPEPERSGNYPIEYGPLIMTEWGQGDVNSWENNYNKYCPYYESGGKTYKAVTGCVATALAQILYYFNVSIPRRNISYAFRHMQYNPRYGFPRYDYLMLSGIHGIHNSELENGCILPRREYYSLGGWNEYGGINHAAKMMLDCGLAVDMKYGHESGAEDLQQYVCSNEFSAETAMKQYFHFPNAFGYEKDDILHWEDTLKKYICHNIPFMYGGYKVGGGGHSFICDGYDSNNKFHFNFGWNGKNNGNFYICDVNGYNVRQCALFTKPVKDDDYIIIYDTIQLGESKNYDWCNGLIRVMPGIHSYVSKDSIIYDNRSIWYRLTNHCEDISTTLMLNVFIEKPGDTIMDSRTICRREAFDYHGFHNNQPFIIHFYRDETDYSGVRVFYKNAFSLRTGEFLALCKLILTTEGTVEENHLPPVTVSRCDLPYHGDYYLWDTGDEIIRCQHSGTYEKVYERDGECERVDYLHLTITEPENKIFTDTLLCYNSCPFYFRGILIDLQSDTIGRITRYNVCENDVLYTLELHLIDTVPEVLAHTICTDEAPFTWRGHTLPWTTPGNYDTVFRVTTTECMCDTIFYISLSIFDCCDHDLGCIAEGLEEGNKSTSSNLEAIYYGLKHYFDYRGAMNGFLVNVLKGVTWYNIEERNSFWNLFQSLLDPNTGMMSEEAMQQLIATNPYGYVTEDYITELVERYNQSVMYWNEGQYSVWYLPQGYNPDNFIEYDTASMNKAYEAYDYAIAHGFSDVKAMYDNAYELLAAEVDNIQSSVCARVTVQFNQKMTMTREAFNGTLQIFNGHESIPMEDIFVDFRIEDQQGNDCTNLFQINTLSLDQITGISGDGSLAAQTNGTAMVQFIPTKNAAPTQPVVYSFGGSFSFIDPFTGEGLTYPLYPVDITVNPSPDLYVDYFMQRDILGDDALTLDVVEPSIPAELGVIIHNQGAGTAKNVLLETAEPQIIDNEKGLAIDFAMYGASFNGSPRQLGLMEIPFGNIESGQTAVGEWLFTSSLLGHFVSYTAHVIHNSSYGSSDLSLVSHLDIHELIHPIYAYGNLDDGINDFLVNDNPDAYDTPDSIYFSHGGRTAVGIVDDISYDHVVTPLDTIVTLTINPSRIGWNYGVTSDPGVNKYDIVSCTRNIDNQEIPLSNVWQTFVTIPDGSDPVYENKLHIVDTLSNDVQNFTYTLVYSLKTNLLDIEEISGIPESYIDYPLESFTVRFNEAIIDSTFTYEDMTLKCQNGPNLMDESVVITKVTDSIFNVNISSLTNESGLFVLNVNTLNINDRRGYGGYNGKQTSWVQALTNDTVYISGDQTVCESVDFAPLTSTVEGNVVSYQWQLNGIDIEGANDMTYQPTTGGVYSLTVTFVNGNVITSNEVILLTYQIHEIPITAEICFGEDYIENGFNLIAPEVGTHNETLYLQSVHGCDSIVNLALVVHPLYETSLSAEICFGEDYTLNGFNLIAPEVGIYNETLNLQSVHGCDSIVNLALVVHPLYETSLSAEICEGEDYTENGFNLIAPEIGIHNESLNLQTVHGCDSIVSLTLTVNSVFNTEITAEICEGEDYTENGFNLIAPEVGIYNETLNLQSVHGCDSIVSLTLTVNSVFNTEITAEICEGEDYTENGFNLIAPEVGIYNETLNLQSVHGCDSIVSLTLTVIANPVVTIEGDTLVTSGSSVTLTASGADNYEWSTGETTSVIVVTPDETTTYSVIGYDENGCSGDASITVFVVTGTGEEYSSIPVKIYPNPTHNSLIVEGENMSSITIMNSLGVTIHKISGINKVKCPVNMTNYPSGIYYLKITTRDGETIHKVVKY